MNHLLTLGDKNYLVFALCLYESLTQTSSQEFKLHYLALDQETKETLLSLNADNIIVYTLSDLEKDNQQFAELRQNNESRPIDTSDGQSPFHWMLASFFSYYLMDAHDLPHTLYIDSDICFYGDIKTVFEAVGEKSIGLITHKHIQLDRSVRNPGYYNVGIIYFKNDEAGKGCLRFWKDCCVYPDNEYAEIFGACGDQKYLELFDEKFGAENIETLCYKVGNGAPWNFPMIEFTEDNKMIWKDPQGIVLEKGAELEQDLIFNHYSHFCPDYERKSFTIDREGEWGAERFIQSQTGVLDLYVNYFNRLIKIKEKYEL